MEENKNRDELTIYKLIKQLNEAERCWCDARATPRFGRTAIIDGRNAYFVECPKCGMKVGSFSGFFGAVKEWNNEIQKHYTENRNV